MSFCSGQVTGVPQGYVSTNLDPELRGPHNNEIYDPNFIPGFSVGLPNTSIDWSTGVGFAKIGYSVGPWKHDQWAIPHFAMGPQCCNFVEVPHTQQFRLPNWGDYYYVRAGFGPPGVNVENYTSTFGQSVPYVGLDTKPDWTVRISLNWSLPQSLNPANEWAALGITVTQYVPGSPGQLLYTLVNFWMDQNSSKSLSPSGALAGTISGKELVVYHPVQLQREGNQTVSVDISPYLSDTIKELNISTDSQRPPIISYVYMNVEGYNFRWSGTVWSYYILTPETTATPLLAPYILSAVGAGVLVVYLLYYQKKIRTRGPTA